VSRVDDSYDRYVRAEWALLARDPARGAAAREAVAGLTIRRVLDIGCGAGQELRPFLDAAGAFGVGIDVAPSAGRAARALFAAEDPARRVAFARAGAEHLPFADASFDVVICRLALPYTDNARALREMARVLRPGGALFLKFQHARYYFAKFREGLTSGDVKSAVHACRVLVAGALYHVTGTQPRGNLTGGETFQTMWLLGRELRRSGLNVRRVLADTVPAAPSLLIDRAPTPRT
jgi:ubiquinone/menaquinone biosynthesis C-methylase UbiE